MKLINAQLKEINKMILLLSTEVFHLKRIILENTSTCKCKILTKEQIDALNEIKIGSTGFIDKVEPSNK